MSNTASAMNIVKEHKRLNVGIVVDSYMMDEYLSQGSYSEFTSIIHEKLARELANHIIKTTANNIKQEKSSASTWNEEIRFSLDVELVI